MRSDLLWQPSRKILEPKKIEIFYNAICNMNLVSVGAVGAAAPTDFEEDSYSILQF